MESTAADKLELTELANKLFMYTDSKNWAGLQTEVFAAEVNFDMESMGGGPAGVLTSVAITNGWEEGLKDLDSVHHQAGHYLINVDGDRAAIYGYAAATHFKSSALNGNTRSFTGSYDLSALRTHQGWRLDGFRYNLKFADGNIDLL